LLHRGLAWRRQGDRAPVRHLAGLRAPTGSGEGALGSRVALPSLGRACRSSLIRTALALMLAALAPGAAAGESWQPRTPALRVVADDSVVLTAADERRVALKIFFPERGGPYPLIVLSHGTFSSIHRYDAVAGYWAGQGYVVILPQHVDADYGVKPSGYAVMQEVIRTRVADMSLVLDQLDAIEAQLPGTAGKVTRGAYAAAGHSIGTQVAMLVTGARFRTDFNGEVMDSPETRYRALVLVSDPGKMRLMPPDTWQASPVPTLMATGTEDFGLMGSRAAPTERQTEILSATAKEVPRYELLLDGGDHYFGGLIQKNLNNAEPDHAGLAIFNATATAFLDAVMKADPAARHYLDTVDLPAVSDGRATLTRWPPPAN
jgi:dienelactone hydrolase